MNYRDVYFLGLLALGYLYLGARRDETLEEELPHQSVGIAPAEPARFPITIYQASAGPRVIPVRVVASRTCPRDSEHAVSVRTDGAMWCRGCDRAFYPDLPERRLAGAA